MPSDPLRSLPTPMSITGTTDVYLCVADPIAQVKAPKAYNLLFERAGIDAVCVPARVPAAELGAFVRAAFAVPNFRGMLVSIPHKTALLDVLDRVDHTARAAGSANTVRRGADGRLEGGLFDGSGFVAALAHHGVADDGRRVLLVGAGGAGLAIAAALVARPLAELAVFDADVARAATLVERCGVRAKAPLTVARSADPAGFDIVINATPLGLNAADPLPFDTQRLDAGATVMDILMTAAPTALLRACRTRAVRAFPGHEMLIQQVPATLAFFGQHALAAQLRTPGDPVMDEVRRLMTPTAGPD